MRAKFRERHFAKCSCCGNITKESESGTFIDPYFLPKMCENCGENMYERGAYLRNPDGEPWPHWRHKIIKEKFIPPVKTANPFTWLRIGKWMEVDKVEFSA